MADEQSSSSASPSASEALANDGAYIVVEHYSADGQTITGYSTFPYAQGKSWISESVGEAVETTLATYQNAEGNFQVAESQYEGVIYTCCVVIVAALFMCLGAIASRTLLKSFER